METKQQQKYCCKRKEFNYCFGVNCMKWNINGKKNSKRERERKRD